MSPNRVSSNLNEPQPNPRFFYGWVVVAVLGIIGGISTFIGVGNFGVFVVPMSEDLGVGNSYFGWALSARLFGFAISGPLIGRCIDKYGTRLPLAIGGFLFGGSAIAFFFIEAGWQMIGITLFAGITGFWGSSTLYLTVPIAIWFVKKRGRAMSLFFPCVPLGIGLGSPATQLVIDAFGWRGAWLVLGVVGGLSITVLSLVFVRNDPSSIGLLPDGEVKSIGNAQSANSSIDEYPWTLREAMATGAFWKISASYGLLMAAMGSVGVFWIPFLRSIDISPHIAALAFSTQAFTQVIAAILIAPWIDRISPRYLAMSGFTSVAIALVIAANASEAWHGFLGATLIGLGIGTAMLMQTHIWPVYFGRVNIGAIRGAATPITLVMTATGAPILSILFDNYGFATGWVVAGVALTVGIALLLISPKPFISVPGKNNS